MIWSFQIGTKDAEARHGDLFRVVVPCHREPDLEWLRKIHTDCQGRDVALACDHASWWISPCQRGPVCDFLGYLGADITHLSPVGHVLLRVPHRAYLAGRLEKLYTNDQLERWTP